MEGQPFWDSFSGYHNLQRFTSVVNDHLQPWWFRTGDAGGGSSFHSLLLIGLAQGLRGRPEPSDSLQQFSSSWLLAVPAVHHSGHKTPQLLVACHTGGCTLIALIAAVRVGRSGGLAEHSGSDSALAAGFWSSPLWVPLIGDPEMPTLAPICWPAALCFVLRAGSRLPG